MKGTLQLLIVIILSIGGILLLSVGYIFFLMAFLPSVIAWFIDGSAKKDTYKTILSANICGVSPYAFPLIGKSHPAATLQVMMVNETIWMHIAGAVLAGWALLKLCGIITYYVLVFLGETRVTLLERGQKDLVEEWGEAIVQASPY